MKKIELRRMQNAKTRTERIEIKRRALEQLGRTEAHAYQTAPRCANYMQFFDADPFHNGIDRSWIRPKPATPEKNHQKFMAEEVADWAMDFSLETIYLAEEKVTEMV